MFKNDFVEKNKTLKQIKPREDWVILVKSQILEEEPSTSSRELFSAFFGWKPLLAGAMSLAVLIGVFVLSQNSLPGDSLYRVKKISEKGRVFLVSEQKKPRINLELANKRLEELTRLVKTNGGEKLNMGIKEFQASVAEAAKNLTGVKVTKQIVEETKKLAENKEKIEALGVEVGGIEELDEAMAQLVKREIEALETRVLTEAQEQALAEIQQDYEAEDYFQALEKILLLSYDSNND